jgi:hypothetical protein
MGREPEPEPEPEPPRPPLTVVGGVHEEPSLDNGRGRESGLPGDEPPAREVPPSQPDRRLSETAHVDPTAPAPIPSQDIPGEISLGNGSPAGARLLATQMAVSGSSRAEIEARLRNGFQIADTGAILDAILGPEN